MVHDSAQASNIIQKEAIVSGVINAVINGIIGWFMFQGKATIPLTVRYHFITRKNYFFIWGNDCLYPVADSGCDRLF